MHAQQRICTISINLNISNRVARSIPKIQFENTDSQIRLHTATDCRLLPFGFSDCLRPNSGMFCMYKLILAHYVVVEKWHITWCNGAMTSLWKLDMWRLHKFVIRYFKNRASSSQWQTRKITEYCTTLDSNNQTVTWCFVYILLTLQSPWFCWFLFRIRAPYEKFGKSARG